MAVKGGIEIIKALARKLITRDQTGIKRIPTQMEAEGEAGAIAAQIQQATGLRPGQLDKAIKSEEQVLSILNDLEYRSALSKQKESLKEFTKKEDVYEGMIDPKFPKSYLYTKKDGTKVKMTGDENLDYDYVETPEGYQIVPGSEGAFYRFGEKNKELIKKGSETEQQLKLRMERENKEAAERIRKKKAEESKTDPEDFASGGIARVGMFGGGPIVKGGAWIIKNLRKSVKEVDQGTGPYSKLNPMQQGLLKKELNTLIKQLEQGGKIPDDMLQTMRQDKRFKDIVKTPSTDPELRELEEVLLDTSSGKKLEQKQILEEFDVTGRTKQASGGIAGQLHLNQGGRVKFDKGGVSRRKFLKLMGGLAALPVVGKFFKFAKPTAKVVEAVKASDAAGMPAWFPKLVDKVIKEGEEVSGDLERVITHKAKLPNSKTDVYVTQDLTTGDTLVDIGMGKHGWSDGWNGQPVRMQLKKGEVIQEGQFKGKKSKDEFDIEEAEFTGDAESVKYEDSSFSKYGEQGSDFSEVEKYATGKVSKESKAQKQIWEADWDDSLPDEDFAKGGLAGVLKL
jgi:hypothetical protein